MKTTLFALLFLSASAFGQVAGAFVSNEPQPIQIPGHPQRASQQPMQTEQSLLFNVLNDTSARGERPLWEAGAKPPAEIPLGDIARLLRNEHATAKKAVKVLEK